MWFEIGDAKNLRFSLCVSVVRDQTKKQKISMYFVQSKNGKRNPSWVRIRKWKKRPFFSIWQKWRWWHLAFWDCKKEIDDCNFWSTVQIQLSHIKNFQEQHSSVVVSAPGGSYFVKRTTRKNWKVLGVRANPLTPMNWIFCYTLSLNFYDPVQNFNANIANYQVGLGIEFFAIHFPWKEADRKRNLTSVSIPKTNRMNDKNRSNLILFLIEIF